VFSPLYLRRPRSARGASDHRYVGLAILSADGDRLAVQAPPDRNYAPPGFYMLFLVDQAGVPSIARWMRVAAP
jgi:hypothetical protein